MDDDVDQRIPPRRDRRRRSVSVLVRRRRRARLQPHAGPHRELRPVRRRRRLHRSVDRDHRQGARPVARRHPDRRPRGRLGGQRPQRRVHGVQPHPRRRQRPGPLPRRARAARRARPEEPQRHRGGDQALRHRLRLRAHRRHRRRHDRTTARRTSTSCATTTSSCARSARRSSCSTARRCAPRSTRPPTPAGCGARTAPRSSIRPGWCGGSRPPPNRSASRIYEDTKATSIEKDGVGVHDQHAARRGAGRQGGAGDQRVQAAAASGSATTSRRSTTTAWSPSRSPPQQLADIGWANRQGLSATSPTSSTTTGSPRTTGSCGAATTPSTSGAARSTPSSRAGRRRGPSCRKHFFDHLPAARGRQVHPRVGRRDRHVQPVLRVLGPGDAAAASAYALGYTGLGVASSRFGAEVMLDLLDGKRSEGHADQLRQGEAAAVPARAVPLHRHPGHPLVAQPRRPHRQAQPLAPQPRPAWASASTADPAPAPTGPEPPHRVHAPVHDRDAPSFWESQPVVARMRRPSAPKHHGHDSRASLSIHRPLSCGFTVVCCSSSSTYVIAMHLSSGIHRNALDPFLARLLRSSSLVARCFDRCRRCFTPESTRLLRSAMLMLASWRLPLTAQHASTSNLCVPSGSCLARWPTVPAVVASVWRRHLCGDAELSMLVDRGRPRHLFAHPRDALPSPFCRPDVATLASLWAWPDHVGTARTNPIDVLSTLFTLALARALRRGYRDRGWRIELSHDAELPLLGYDLVVQWP